MNKMSKAAVFIIVFSFTASPAYPDSGHSGGANNLSQGSSQSHEGRGTINRIDIAAGIINISHEEIKSLRWPKMTMDYYVQDKSILAGLRPGTNVNFDIAKMVQGYQIMRITPIKD